MYVGVLVLCEVCVYVGVLVVCEVRCLCVCVCVCVLVCWRCDGGGGVCVWGGVHVFRASCIV